MTQLLPVLRTLLGNTRMSAGGLGAAALGGLWPYAATELLKTMMSSRVAVSH
jgi:hypothetical protein